MDIPRLSTDRAVMRGFCGADFGAYAALSADPVAMRFIGGPCDAGTAWRSLAMFAGHWQLRGYGTWAVERTRDGAFLGRVGLWQPHGWPGLEVGWALLRTAWGQGYATECARAAVEWAWGNLEIDRLISLIHPENARSVAVAQRLGMTPDGNWLMSDGRRVILYALTRSG